MTDQKHEYTPTAEEKDESLPSIPFVKTMYAQGCKHERGMFHAMPVDSEPEFDRWLAAHDAEVARLQREKDARIIERVAAYRAEYIHEGDLFESELQLQVNTLKQVARILRGDPDSYQGLLPSWRWGEFSAAIRNQEGGK